ncbi:uncharacterized protein LOC119732247 isoform X2 [Patiria miniata]|uniref:Uncharacterized protein n=1 Tax=Patiria miniata TaxID=46514 RepID=A0A914AE34_PATMI|nr:uncharacterized protein LOC119732247 isoform X2 [Patiria miniata]
MNSSRKKDLGHPPSPTCRHRFAPLPVLVQFRQFLWLRHHGDVLESIRGLISAGFSSMRMGYYNSRRPHSKKQPRDSWWKSNGASRIRDTPSTLRATLLRIHQRKKKEDIQPKKKSRSNGSAEGFEDCIFKLEMQGACITWPSLS